MAGCPGIPGRIKSVWVAGCYRNHWPDRPGIRTVYHCDIFGSNELQQGSPDKHYQCALLQADGRRDLENDPSNQGDSEDLYSRVDGTALTSLSNPNSREWDRRESGLVISDISSPSEKITFRVGEIGAALIAQGTSTPSLAIPDNDPLGVTDSITIAESGVIHRIKIKVDISHTYIGDLMIELRSPTGAREILHAQQGGSQDDISIAFDSERPGELANLVGKSMQGVWRLNVSDRARIDNGKLEHWQIEIENAAMV